MKRVAVTGMGAITPLGQSVAELWEALKAGRHGIGPITHFDASKLKAKLAAEVKDFKGVADLEAKEARRLDPFCLYALAAAKEAWASARLDQGDYDPHRAGCYIGSGIGGMQTFLQGQKDLEEKGTRRVSPFLIPSMISNMATGLVAMKLKLEGPALPIVTACATSSHSLGEAFRSIKHGYADVMVAGGTEAAVTELAMAGFVNCMALSLSEDPDRASIPFDADRNGFVMGEGAGVLVLEEWDHAVNRGATILAEITGYGNTCDAYHMTAPEPEGKGAAQALRLALEEAGGVEPATCYYNAHGTSTPLNDTVETKVLKQVFKEAAYDLSISSVKSMTGHMLGAAGAVEAIASIQAMREGIIPPTVGYAKADPDLDLDYTPNLAKEKQIDTAISASLGFGGHNAMLVLRKVNHG